VRVGDGSTTAVIGFADCELDLGRMELRRAGQLVAVEPQVFDVLAHLARNADRMVSKNELLDEIWGSRFVSESALTSRIKSARRAIGDTGRDQRMIRTVHGRGYRFVAQVAPHGRTAGSDPPPPPSRGVLELDTVRAVLELVATEHGDGVALAVVGPLGAGKSDALHRLAEDAASLGLLVGRGSA
jgi:DNA-binding winged helix-turn-helix (wHTH) protein